MLVVVLQGQVNLKIHLQKQVHPPVQVVLKHRLLMKIKASDLKVMLKGKAGQYRKLFIHSHLDYIVNSWIT
jgi:hypothetical protein